MIRTRRIAHLDMDAFFASVELLSYPELRGLPVVVGGRNASAHAASGASGIERFTRLKDYAGRGVVTTSTYEARALGVFSGMGLMKSALLAPQAILLPANFEAYRHYLNGQSPRSPLRLKTAGSTKSISISVTSKKTRSRLPSE